MLWDEWRGSLDGRPTFYSKRLLQALGWRVCLHKFVSADDPECFHSHPATAIRIVLWGGYEEEVLINPDGTFLHARRLGYVGRVQPDLIHRIHKLLNGHVSYSLWIRGPKTNDIQLLGEGWAKQK